MFNDIDIYCERLGPGLWAEPFNAVSNLAFFLAGFAALYLARKKGALNTQSVLILIILVFAMGVGSTLFHTVAKIWAMLADVLPILIYQICFLGLYAAHIMKWNLSRVALLLAAFFIAMKFAMSLPRDWMNGSLEYAPALLFLFGLSLYHLRHAKTEKWGLFAAVITFIASFAFRSVDMRLCSINPLGTHFVWHILNGAVLYLTTRAFILNVKLTRMADKKID